MDRGTQHAAVHGAAKNQTLLKRPRMHAGRIYMYVVVGRYSDQVKYNLLLLR